MKTLDIQETNIDLTALLDEAIATQGEIMITRNGVPIARIVPCETKTSSTANYPLRGMPIKIAEADFGCDRPTLQNSHNNLRYQDS
jgi:prevent-host-death family protein